MEPRWSRDQVEIRLQGLVCVPRWSRDGAEMEPRWSRDGAEMEPRWSRDGAVLRGLRRVVWRGRPRLGRRAGGNLAARRQGARVSALQAAARRRLGRVLLVVLDEGVPPCRRVAGPPTH